MCSSTITSVVLGRARSTEASENRATGVIASRDRQNGVQNFDTQNKHPRSNTIEGVFNLVLLFNRDYQSIQTLVHLVHSGALWCQSACVLVLSVLCECLLMRAVYRQSVESHVV